MKNTIYNYIQSLFKSGEIQTIKFAKNGKVMVKFRTEPRAVTYPANEKNIQYIIEDAKLRESLEVIKFRNRKPKIKLSVDEFVKIHTMEAEFKKPSLFERFYDSVSNFIGGGKSFAPNELKTFA